MNTLFEEMLLSFCLKGILPRFYSSVSVIFFNYLEISYCVIVFNWTQYYIFWFKPNLCYLEKKIPICSSMKIIYVFNRFLSFLDVSLCRASQTIFKHFSLYLLAATKSRYFDGVNKYPRQHGIRKADCI